MDLNICSGWVYEIVTRFHVTSRFAGLSKQFSQNIPSVQGDEQPVSGGLGDEFPQCQIGFPF
jgi:hypothetical protein